LWVHDSVKLAPAREVKIALPSSPAQSAKEDDLKTILARNTDYLTRYQSQRYAKQYQRVLQPLFNADTSLQGVLSRTAAQGLFKLMAYKDEYEVARLYSDGSFLASVAEQFEGDYQLHVHLAPPMLSKISESTGRPVKRRFGPWMLRAMPMLAVLKRLRGTPFDVFGYSAERRMERSLISQYKQHIAVVTSALSTGAVSQELAQQLLALPDNIRGFGPVKAESVAVAKAQADALLSEINTTGSSKPLTDGKAA